MTFEVDMLQNYNGTYDQLFDKAKSGDGLAVLMMADMYANGLLGNQVDSEKAYRLLEIFCQHHNEVANTMPIIYHSLGVLCQATDNNVSSSWTGKLPLLALKWYSKAADCGYIASMYNLALVYLNQTDYQNTQKADDILQKIIEQTADDDADIILKLEAAYILWQLWSSKENPMGNVMPGKAITYLRTAAEGGLAMAERELGIVYLKGLFGHPVDLHNAHKWLLKASKKGDKEAVDILQNLPDYVTAAKDTQRGNWKETEKKFAFDSFSSTIETAFKNKLKQNVTPTSVLTTADKEKTITRDTLKAYQQYPTARTMLRAWDLYANGFKLMLSSMDGSSDEGFLEGAELWAEGRAIETMFESRLFPSWKHEQLSSAVQNHTEKYPENFILQY